MNDGIPGLPLDQQVDERIADSLPENSIGNLPTRLYIILKIFGKRLNDKERCKKCDFLIACSQLFLKMSFWEGIAVLIQKLNRHIWHKTELKHLPLHWFGCFLNYLLDRIF